MWLNGDPNGKNANLRGANLQGANLQRANLQRANLQGADLWGANLQGADLWGADLQGANLWGANLRGADLQRANLQRANLWGANLQGADLWGANLQRANLQRANLWGAMGCNKHRTTDLYILLDQPGKVRAYKLVNKNGYGPYRNEIQYRTGQTYEAEINPDENEQCGAGINLATLAWCMSEWRPGYRILIAEFSVKDPATDICIPVASDGKFRVRKCKIVGEKDLKELGLEEVAS